MARAVCAEPGQDVDRAVGIAMHDLGQGVRQHAGWRAHGDACELVARAALARVHERAHPARGCRDGVSPRPRTSRRLRCAAFPRRSTADGTPDSGCRAARRASPHTRRSPPALTQAVSMPAARIASIAWSTANPLAMPPRSIASGFRKRTQWPQAIRHPASTRSGPFADAGQAWAGNPIPRAAVRPSRRTIPPMRPRCACGVEHRPRARIDHHGAACGVAIQPGHVAVRLVEAHQCMDLRDGAKAIFERTGQSPRIVRGHADIDQRAEQRPAAAQTT